MTFKILFTLVMLQNMGYVIENFYLFFMTGDSVCLVKGMIVLILSLLIGVPLFKDLRN